MENDKSRRGPLPVSLDQVQRTEVKKKGVQSTGRYGYKEKHMVIGASSGSVVARPSTTLN